MGNCAMATRFLLIAILSAQCISPLRSQAQSQTPPSRIQCKFADGNAITMSYSNLRMDGHKVFGDSVPYGQVWQIGPKSPPTFVTSSNLLVGGKSVPAGSYTVFIIPELQKWTLILNKRAEGFSLLYTYESSELVRADLTLRPLASPIETLAITFDQRFGGCVLNFRWEKTEASVLIAETK